MLILGLWTFHFKKPKDNVYDQPKKKKPNKRGHKFNGVFDTGSKRNSVGSFSEHESVMLADKLNSPSQEC